jgi:hypothetical protein
MIKKLLLLIYLIPATACTSQVTRHNIVLLENICAEKLEISAANRSNFNLSEYRTLLAPGGKAVVASYMAYTESVFDQVQGEYKLKVSSSSKTLVLGKDELLDRLSEVRPVVKGNSRTWVFSDKSLCPE